jgi:predicted outer membrane repeat protein
MKTRKKLFALLLSALMTATLLAGFAVSAGAVGDDATMIFVDGQSSVNGNGDQATPFNNIADALRLMAQQPRRNIIYILSQVTISASTAVTSNVPGATIQRSDNYRCGNLFAVMDGTLTIGGGGTGNAIVIDGNGTANAGSMIFVGSGTGILAIADGATLQNGNANSAGGGAVLVRAGTLNMTGGTIQNNTSVDQGGAIYIMAGTSSITGGLIAGNSGTRGGGVSVNGGATLNINGTAQFTANIARNTGGAVLVNGTVNLGCATKK